MFCHLNCVITITDAGASHVGPSWPVFGMAPATYASRNEVYVDPAADYIAVHSHRGCAMRAPSLDHDDYGRGRDAFQRGNDGYSPRGGSASHTRQGITRRGRREEPHPHVSSPGDSPRRSRSRTQRPDGRRGGHASDSPTRRRDRNGSTMAETQSSASRGPPQAGRPGMQQTLRSTKFGGAAGTQLLQLRWLLKTRLNQVRHAEGSVARGALESDPLRGPPAAEAASPRWTM